MKDQTMMKGDVLMFNRHSGYNKPHMMMGAAPANMAYPPMGAAPGSQVMGTFSGKITPGYPAPTAVSPAGVSPMPYAPAPVSPTNVLPTQVAPTQVSPTQQMVNTNVMNTVVPHVHPSHTTTVNKHVFTHKHYFPHTQSVVNQCCEQHLVCPGPGPATMPMHHPVCPPRPRPPFC